MGAFNIEEIDKGKLDQFRSQTDPLADQAIQAIIQSGSQEKVNELMGQLFRNDSFEKGMFTSLGSELSDIIDTYLEDSSALPSWADQKLIRKGEQVFSIYGPEIFMLLNVASLPLCYTCAKGAQVLYETGRLLTHNGSVDPLARRLMETAQMVVNVLSLKGLSPNGKGVVTLQKVRLVHASIRYYLKEGQYEGEPWNTEEYGEPINQEDLAGTLMSFGPVILKGLERLNVKLRSDQRAAYMHCWKVVGHMMGIDEQLLPDTYEEGQELATRILEHQAASSEAGKALTESCIKFMSSIIPGNAFDEFPAFLIDYFLQGFSESAGVDLSKCIGVSSNESAKDKITLKLSKFLVSKVSDLNNRTFIRSGIENFNRLFMHGIIHHFNDGKQVHFYIPPSLQKNWGVTSRWKRRLKP